MGGTISALMRFSGTEFGERSKNDTRTSSATESYFSDYFVDDGKHAVHFGDISVLERKARVASARRKTEEYFKVTSCSIRLVRLFN